MGSQRVDFHFHFHMQAKWCSKFSKPGFNNMRSENFQMFKMKLESVRNHRSNCQHPLDQRKSKRIPEKHFWKTPTSASLTTLNHLTVWITTNWKFFKRWEYQTTLPASWEICMQVKKQKLELDMKQRTGSKLGKEYVKPLYCHPAYLTYLQNTSCEMLGWMKHKQESRFRGEISITSDIQMRPFLWQRLKRS